MLMKILVAADGSTYTQRMLAYLAAHDEWLGSAHQYTVVYGTPIMPPRARAYFDRETLKSYNETEFEKVFKPVRTFFKRHGIDATFAGKSGPAADVIGALGNLMMGSVATKVMATCTTPILIVR